MNGEAGASQRRDSGAAGGGGDHCEEAQGADAGHAAREARPRGIPDADTVIHSYKDDIRETTQQDGRESGDFENTSYGATHNVNIRCSLEESATYHPVLNAAIT